MTEKPSNEKTIAQAELLFNRLLKRRKHLKKWARRTGTNAFRVYDRDIPEIPLVLDLYADGLAGALYKRPYEKDEAEEALWLDTMKGAASRALEIPEDHIFLKTRQRQRGKEQYNRISKNKFERDIEEGGLLFRVNLSDYLDTGLFLDSRKRRALIGLEAKDRKVLDLFSYTCSASVYAASGGAREIDSVDMSKTYLDWGKVNFSLNGFSAHFADTREGPEQYRRDMPRSAAPPYRLIRADVLEFMEQAVRTRKHWDLVILDPPGFSNSKKMKTTLDLNRDHVSLISLCLKLLSKGGKLIFSTNIHHFSLDREKLPRVSIRELEKELVDEDFSGKKVPRCYEIKKTD